MKITAISVQAKDPNRVNISIDGTYRFSLDIAQVIELGLRIGRDCSDQELKHFEQESQYGKLYSRSLEYCLARPRSAKEIRDYLWRKTQITRYKSRKTGEILEKSGVSSGIADRVLEKLLSRGYVDDERFARYWVENRFLKKGASIRRLKQELTHKGVVSEVINKILSESSRNDVDELQKVIAKKRARYSDEQKFKQYLARQGFSYDDIREQLDSTT